MVAEMLEAEAVFAVANKKLRTLPAISVPVMGCVRTPLDPALAFANRFGRR
jgi:hypothetical protein